MDDFTRQYLETALWSSLADDDEPMDKDYSLSDIAPETVAQAEIDCAKFQSEHAADLAVFAEAYDDETPGHCLWLNRNGHGTGFWDRDVSSVFLFRVLNPRLWRGRRLQGHRTRPANKVAIRAASDLLVDRLSVAATAMGEINLYEGDDGQIYA
jgi:hypothetical protein